ncbi:hypothetical protein BKA62DRAFT_437252 [Auriculariales sp. MPI-PUGE-AT-0066]|nr:hypothetical protein BKA62DRAFT_437252 [Auriculariales sp. MPI-PUGE-AT-0066]
MLQPTAERVTLLQVVVLRLLVACTTTGYAWSYISFLVAAYIPRHCGTLTAMIIFANQHGNNGSPLIEEERRSVLLRRFRGGHDRPAAVRFCLRVLCAQSPELVLSLARSGWQQCHEQREDLHRTAPLASHPAQCRCRCCDA